MLCLGTCDTFRKMRLSRCCILAAVSKTHVTSPKSVVRCICNVPMGASKRASAVLSLTAWPAARRCAAPSPPALRPHNHPTPATGASPLGQRRGRTVGRQECRGGSWPSRRRPPSRPSRSPPRYWTSRSWRARASPPPNSSSSAIRTPRPPQSWRVSSRAPAPRCYVGGSRPRCRTSEPTTRTPPAGHRRRSLGLQRPASRLWVRGSHWGSWRRSARLCPRRPGSTLPSRSADQQRPFDSACPRAVRRRRIPRRRSCRPETCRCPRSPEAAAARWWGRRPSPPCHQKTRRTVSWTAPPSLN
mmetsp:Transcript_17953/g.63020  ORF Transcript_17953/g.63020 Transcript_17953/m.63020 type:complete len:301 (-) Transcript_17953:1199-2101(-)